MMLIDGVPSLNNKELLAVFIGSGGSGRSVEIGRGSPRYYRSQFANLG